MNIKDSYHDVLNSIPDNVSLIAVSKTKPVSDIQILYSCGQRMFGENKVQELIEKQPQLPSDIEWHFIGHLQRNKVKLIVPFINCIQSIDSLRLLKEINTEAKKYNRMIDCFIEFHIAKEISKYGMSLEEGIELLGSDEYKVLNNIRICGVMGMATNTDDIEIIKNDFKKLKNIYDKIHDRFFRYVDYFKHISMGMSEDYHIAIEEGSTMVRVGSAIFGHR